MNAAVWLGRLAAVVMNAAESQAGRWLAALEGKRGPVRKAVAQAGLWIFIVTVGGALLTAAQMLLALAVLVLMHLCPPLGGLAKCIMDYRP